MDGALCEVGLAVVVLAAEGKLVDNEAG